MYYQRNLLDDIGNGPNVLSFTQRGSIKFFFTAKQPPVFFTRVPKTAESEYSLVCVCQLSACNSAPTGRIFIKFDISLTFRKSVDESLKLATSVV